MGSPAQSYDLAPPAAYGQPVPPPAPAPERERHATPEAEARLLDRRPARVEPIHQDAEALIASEIRRHVETLNQLLVNAQSQGMKVDLTVKDYEMRGGGEMRYLDVRLFRQI